MREPWRMKASQRELHVGFHNAFSIKEGFFSHPYKIMAICQRQLPQISAQTEERPVTKANVISLHNQFHTPKRISWPLDRLIVISSVIRASLDLIHPFVTLNIFANQRLTYPNSLFQVVNPTFLLYLFVIVGQKKPHRRCEALEERQGQKSNESNKGEKEEFLLDKSDEAQEQECWQDPQLGKRKMIHRRVVQIATMTSSQGIPSILALIVTPFVTI